MNFAIVTAAGKGTRFGGPKALHPLQNRPLLAWALAPFEQNPSIDQILITIPPEDPEETYRSICERENFRKVKIVRGGETRFHSVRNAFLSIQKPEGVVLIHDAARPLISSGLINRVLEATEKFGAVVPVVSVAETIKQVEGNRILRTIEREKLFLAQTPQGFDAKILTDAYSKIDDANLTDEAMLAEIAGYEVHVVEGERKNIKITELSDIKIAESYL